MQLACMLTILQAFFSCDDPSLSPEQIAQRLEHVTPPTDRINSRWLRRYASLVTSANTGAVLADV